MRFLPLRGLMISAAAWALTIPFLAWAIVRVTGSERGQIGLVLISYTPHAAVLGGVVAIALVVIRRRAAALTCMAAVVAMTLAVLPRALPGPQPEAEPLGPELTVMSANLLTGEADPQALLKIIREHDVDVLAAQEITPELEQRLLRAGLKELLPHRSSQPFGGAGGFGLYSAAPLIRASRQLRLADDPPAAPVPAGMIDLRGAPRVGVLSIHAPYLGTSVSAGHWVEVVNGMPAPLDRGRITILAGDFNATLDHREIRDLLDRGYRDAADVVGAGLKPTWPSDRPFPPVTIDHILISEGVGVADFSVESIEGSDHRAVIATLRLPKAQR